MVQHFLADHGPLVIKASCSHSDTTHPVGVFRTSDRPDAETSTWQHSQETDINAPGGTRTRNPNDQAATDLTLRPHGHRIDKIRTLSNHNSFITLVLYVIKNLLSLMLSNFWSLPLEAPSGWSWDFPQFRRNLSLLILVWLIVILLSTIRSVAKRVYFHVFEIIFLKLNKYFIKNLNCR
jgi:hypothetical protein